MEGWISLSEAKRDISIDRRVIPDGVLRISLRKAVQYDSGSGDTFIFWRMIGRLVCQKEG